MDSKKLNVSVRMNASDIRKVGELARRLGVRDSHVIRYAIKFTLARLSPLCASELKGADLLPVFMEFGDELATYFDLDSQVLERILNESVEDPDKRVSREDIDLISLSSRHEDYVLMKLGDSAATGKGAYAALRQYLSQKYVHPTHAERDEMSKSPI